jgi:hypothetical protein
MKGKIMNREKQEKDERSIGEYVGKTGREYRQPEIHDLGKLEQVQGWGGFNYDGIAGHLYFDRSK